MNMQRDYFTGELYDADKWYRGGPFGLWHNIEAERRHEESIMAAWSKRCARRNERRKAAEKRARSPSSFRRSAARYQEFLDEDGGLTFGEFLRAQRWRKERLWRLAHSQEGGWM
jgi:hypothetical protein